MKNNNKIHFLYTGIFISLSFLSFISPAFAAATITTVAQNATTSVELLPGLITGLCYIFALVLGVTGILKLKDHVENPSQTPIRVAIIRFFAGGALLALPIVLEAATRTIGDPTTTFGFSAAVSAFTSNLGGITETPTGGDAINETLQNIVLSIQGVPGIVTGVAYLLGLLSCVLGVLKIRDHIENPDRVELKEGVIRLLIGGAMFAIPTVYLAAQNAFLGDGSTVGGTIGTIMPTAGTYLASGFAGDGFATCASAADGTLGATMCNLVQRTGATPAFLTALCYLFGLVIGVWALLKIRDHVLNPQQVAIWEGVSRLIVAGGFFAMPYIAGALNNSIIGGDAFAGASSLGYTWNSSIDCSGTADRALDTAMSCFVQNIMAPIHVLFGHFAFIAGLVFIMIGITRIMKSAQDGARGPGGLGTLSTFIIGAVLISYNQIIMVVTRSIYDGPASNAALRYTEGMTEAEVQHVENVITAILQFMLIIGILSFIRGWFILRSVAEGNSQASMMAGATHILGGALAINLGPLLSSVQTTLNITTIGIGFTS
ncbi:MAG: hypothetical protein ACK4VI_04715 [Alphaproteobacteria bacterium]